MKKPCPRCLYRDNPPEASHCKECGAIFSASAKPSGKSSETTNQTLKPEKQGAPEIGSKWVNPNLLPCPDCFQDVSRTAENCPHCGRPLSALMRRAASTATAGDTINGLLWVALTIYLALICADYATGARLDESAIQQAARAAMSVFWVAVGYCGVRALTEAIRSGRGK